MSSYLEKYTRLERLYPKPPIERPDGENDIDSPPINEFQEVVLQPTPYNKITGIAITSLKVIAAGLCIYYKRHFTALYFAYGAAVMPHQGTLLGNTTSTVWQGTRSSFRSVVKIVVLVAGTCLCFYMPRDTATAIYATYLGYQFYLSTPPDDEINKNENHKSIIDNISNNIYLKSKNLSTTIINSRPSIAVTNIFNNLPINFRSTVHEKIQQGIDKIVSITKNILHLGLLFSLSKLQPGSFWWGGLFGIVNSSEAVSEMAKTINRYWNNNKDIFVLINLAMLRYATGPYLFLSASLYSAYQGYKLKLDSALISKEKGWEDEKGKNNNPLGTRDRIIVGIMTLAFAYTQRSVFAAGLLGGFIFSDQATYASHSISKIWQNNKEKFIGLNIYITLLALPHYYLMATTLFSAYFGSLLRHKISFNKTAHNLG